MRVEWTYSFLERFSMGHVSWLSEFRMWMRLQDQRRTVIAAFPSYRPDLVRDMAAKLAFTYIDYRKENLLPLGWEASRVPLDDITEVARLAMVRGRGVVLHNAEALLAVYNAADRRDWLAGILDKTWDFPLVLPLVLYAGDVPADYPLQFHFPAHQLPDESVLDRLQTFT